jgi:hypothetical protein
MDELDATYHEEAVKESKELGVVALDYNRFASTLVWSILVDMYIITSICFRSDGRIGCKIL